MADHRPPAARRDRAPLILPVTCLVIVLAGVLLWWRPFLTQKRDVLTASPSLAGLSVRTVIPSTHGRSICIAPVPIDRGTARLQVLAFVAPPARRAPALRIAAQAPGYHAVTTVRKGSYRVGADAFLTLPIAGPRHDVTGRVCVSPADGRSRFNLVGTTEPRSSVLAATSVGGKPVAAEAALSLYESRPRAYTARWSAIIDHAAAFTGGWLPHWLLWVLSVLAVLAGVLGAPAALALSLRPGRTGGG